ncbi:hypothetical protein D8823_01900 [Streptococcus gordonii]|nr:hypothetical protein D8823_01900 [Streptococcus gordonii]
MRKKKRKKLITNPYPVEQKKYNFFLKLFGNCDKVLTIKYSFNSIQRGRQGASKKMGGV